MIHIFFCKKIRKIKHMTINIMTTRGIFHCTIMTIDSLVPLRRRLANAVGWLIRPQVTILKQADCCHTWMRLRYVPLSVFSCFHSHFSIGTNIIAVVVAWFLLTVVSRGWAWAEAGSCQQHLVACIWCSGWGKKCCREVLQCFHSCRWVSVTDHSDWQTSI